MTKYKFSLTAVIFAILAPSSLLANTKCSETSNYSSHTSANSAGFEDAFDGACAHTPENLNITLYEFGLCTSAATPNNMSTCTNLFKSDDGKSVDLSKGSALQLAQELSLSEGTYTHAYIKLSNVTSLTGVLEFDEPRISPDGGTGRFCYTNGQSVDVSNSIITCANNPSGAVPSYETIGLYYEDGNGNSVYGNQLLDYTRTVGGQSVVTDLYMLTEAGILSQQESDDFALWGSQRLASPAKISPTTETLEIAISVTDGIVMAFDHPDGNINFTGCSDLNGCVYDAAWEGLKFIVRTK